MLKSRINRIFLSGLLALNIGIASCSRSPKLEERVAMDLPASIEFQPDYEKTLERVIITHKSYPPENPTINEYYSFIRKEDNNGIRARVSIIRNLPEYSKVFLICDKDTKPLFEAEIAKLNTSVQERVSISLAEMHFPRDAFSQDMGAGNGTNFILRNDYPYLITNLNLSGFNVLNSRSVGDGWGNKLLARNAFGEKIVFVGSTLAETDSKNLDQSLDYVKEMYKQTFNADKAVIIPNLNTHPDLQSRSMIHLDQVISFGNDGFAFIAKLPDTNEKVGRIYDGFLRKFKRVQNKGIDSENIMDYFVLKEAFFPEGRRYIPVLYTPKSLREKLTESQFNVLSEHGLYLGLFYHEHISRKLRATEETLAKNGFETYHLHMDLVNMALRQSPLNMTVFTEKESGKKAVLFPIFGPVNREDSKKEFSGMILSFPESYSSLMQEAEDKLIADYSLIFSGKKSDLELEQDNMLRIQQKGFELISVPGEDMRGGNLHCLMNPL